MAEGVNVREIEQVTRGASMLLQVFAEIAKSDQFDPMMPSLVSNNTLSPILVSVTLCGPVVELTVWLPKSAAIGLKLAMTPAVLFAWSATWPVRVLEPVIVI